MQRSLSRRVGPGGVEAEQVGRVAAAEGRRLGGDAARCAPPRCQMPSSRLRRRPVGRGALDRRLDRRLVEVVEVERLPVVEAALREERVEGALQDGVGHRRRSGRAAASPARAAAA